MRKKAGSAFYRENLAAGSFIVQPIRPPLARPTSRITQRVYVASDFLVYYAHGQPTRYVVPDNFVVLNSDPGRRRTFKTWAQGKSPDVVFEVTSRDTAREDLVFKPKIYEEMGVQEYFLYDPSCEYLRDPLLGFRSMGGVLSKILPREDGTIQCLTLGIDLRIEGDDLVIYDSESGALLLIEAEAERQEKEAELRQKEIERTAKESEAEAHRVAEQRIQELLAEIEQLKGDG